MDNFTLKLINDAYDYYKQNQPTPVEWENYRAGDINTFVFDPELDKIFKSLCISSPELIEEVISIIFDVRVDMYAYYREYLEYIACKLDQINNWWRLGKNLRVIRSHIRIVKQSNKTALQCYRNVLREFNNILGSNTGEFLGIEKSLRNIYSIFRGKLINVLLYRYFVPGWDIGILDGVITDIDNCATHFVHRSLRYIIPTTDITVFEFLFMDLNLTHLPILNHEELMVEEFKELEHLIRGRCKKLKEIYDTHLILNEKHSNFPEDCTNHILKYCQENYTLQPSGTRFDVVMWIKF